MFGRKGSYRSNEYKLSIRNTTRIYQHHENDAWQPRKLAYTLHCCREERQKMQPFSSVVRKTAAVLFVRWRSTVSRAIRLVEQYHKTNGWPVGPFAQNHWKVLSVVSPNVFPRHVTCGFWEKHPRTRNHKAEHGRFSNKKNKHQTLKCNWRNSQKLILSLDV